MTESEIQLSTLVEEIKALEQDAEDKKTALRLLLKELHGSGYTMYRLSKITGYSQPTIKAYIQAASAG